MGIFHGERFVLSAQDRARVRAPEITGTVVVWLNTDKPYVHSCGSKASSFLLDFWTYGCINCIHIHADAEKA
jgi:hypothetical protein